MSNRVLKFLRYVTVNVVVDKCKLPVAAWWLIYVFLSILIKKTVFCVKYQCGMNMNADVAE